MLSTEVVVENKNGMDSKAAAMLIQKASNYSSEIWFEVDGKKANVKSLLGLLSLCVSKEDEKIYNREFQRLELSLSLAQKSGVTKILVAIHYPPFDFKFHKSPIIELMEKYKVKLCLYGHLHGEGRKNGFEGLIEGIDFKLISSDHLGFKPIQIRMD